MIPTVDCTNDVDKHSAEIYAALTSVGFVNLVNFGFEPSLVEHVQDTFRRFWVLPDKVRTIHRNVFVSQHFFRSKPSTLARRSRSISLCAY